MTSPVPETRVLLAYFSRAGENYHYGGRRNLTVGNTEVLARTIASPINCDVYQIEAADPPRNRPRRRAVGEERPFRRLWVRQDVVRRAGGPARMRHPEVGDLELHHEKLIIAGTEGQVLVI